MPYPTLKSRVRYVLDRWPKGEPGPSDNQLAIAVWVAFYGHLAPEGSVNLANIPDLPTVQSLRAARRDIDKPDRPDEKPEPPEERPPYWLRD